MPGGINLIFTLLIWTFFTVVLLSNRHSRINQWCFISGLILSLGVFKEYIYFDLIPFLSDKHLPVLSSSQSETMYSIMTAVLYLLAMPSSLIFGFFYSNIKAKKIVYVAIAVFAAALVFIYNPSQYRQYQLNDQLFWLLISIYNLTYGIAITVIMIRTVIEETNPTWRGQKRRVAVLLLPLLWYWLITIFVIHALNIKALFKIWEGNAALIFILLGYYLVMAFREGIMGIKLERINYKWGSEVRTVQQGTQYMNHFLKNEVAKIEWCSNNLAAKSKEEPSEEFKIISRSVDRLKQSINKTQLYSKDIQLTCSSCSIYELIQSCIEDARKRDVKNISFTNNCAKDINILCDPFHITEVLNNLLNNASDAVNDNGTITIELDNSNKKHVILMVKDNGAGIKKEALPHLSDPFYTSRGGNGHFGLGLFYCYRVMQKHGGKIEVHSGLGEGTTFYLYFPKHHDVL